MFEFHAILVKGVRPYCTIERPQHVQEQFQAFRKMISVVEGLVEDKTRITKEFYPHFNLFCADVEDA
eukprot:6550988-Karenia_brevis.AAC.1